MNSLGIFQKTIEVSHEETDSFNHMNPGALARFIGNATMEHNESAGLDYNKLNSHGLLWVLARTELKVNRLPKLGETISLRSWAGEEKFWMYPRRHEIASSTGEKIISACSQWLLIDNESRQLAPPSELMKLIPVNVFPDEPKNPKLRMSFPNELTRQVIRIVGPGEIDLNGHMNNSYYLEWAMDLLETDYLKTHTLHSFWIEYSQELFEGQSVSLHYILVENSLFLRGYTDDGNDSFSVKMDFISHD